MSYRHQRLLGKKNFMIVLAGVVVIIVGFLLMIGGGTTDPNVYPEESMYGFQRTVLAPMLILVGFALQIVAILTKSDVPIIEEPTKAAPDLSKKTAPAPPPPIKTTNKRK